MTTPQTTRTRYRKIAAGPLGISATTLLQTESLSTEIFIPVRIPTIAYMREFSSEFGSDRSGDYQTEWRWWWRGRTESQEPRDRKSTSLKYSQVAISYDV